MYNFDKPQQHNPLTEPSTIECIPTLPNGQSLFDGKKVKRVFAAIQAIPYISVSEIYFLSEAGINRWGFFNLSDKPGQLGKVSCLLFVEQKIL